jgi:hypothetical protein
MDIKFRYYGDVKTAVKHGGIVVCAMMPTGYKDEDGCDEYVVGHSLTQDGMKYDKAFSKAVAKYRAITMGRKLGRDCTGLLDFADELNGVLVSRAAHVRKVVTQGVGVYRTYTKTSYAFTNRDFDFVNGLVIYIKNVGDGHLQSKIDKTVREHFSRSDLFPKAISKLMSAGW